MASAADDGPSSPPRLSRASKSAPSIAPQQLDTATSEPQPYLYQQERRGSLTLRLSQPRASLSRIDSILESARERAESVSQQGDGNPDSPRLRPLLSSSPYGRHHVPQDLSADDNQGGPVTRSPARQTTLNYQSMTQTNQSPRRRQSGRTPSGTNGQTSNAQQHDAGTEPESQPQQPSAWKKKLAYFQSIELENKGSVARDHLALERTFLAWLRTSLAFASIGIAITQLFRLNTSLSNEHGQADTLRHLGKPLGATFLAISILTLFLGYKRYLESQHWIIKGKFPASRGTILLVSFIALAVTVASLIVVLAVQDGR